MRDIIRQEAAGNYTPVVATTYRRKWDTQSKPRLVDCNDGLQYVVKGSQNGRLLFSEYVCGRLGHLIGAPTVQLKFADVTALRQLEPEMSHFGPDLALGSIYVANASDRIDGIQYVDEGDNRARFASLALLYSWAKGGDCQFIYQTAVPRLVYSNDHGNFFPGQGGWTAAQLTADNDVVPHAHFAASGLIPPDYAACKTLIAAVTPEDIQLLVSAPPQGWNIAPDDREAARDYLTRRQARVLDLYG